MVTAFTPAYLYQTSRFLSRTGIDLSPKVHTTSLEKAVDVGLGVARGISSLGLIVLAPCGAFYHVTRAALFALEGLIRESPEPLLRMREHLDAAYFDMAGWLQASSLILIPGIAVGIFMLAALCAEDPDLIELLAHLFMLYLCGLMVCAAEGLLASWILPYHAAMNPHKYRDFCLEGAQRFYDGQFYYEKLVQAGLAAPGEVLTDAQVLEMRRIFIAAKFSGNAELHPVMYTKCKIAGLLLTWNRQNPQVAATLQKWRDREPELRKAWQLVRAASLQILDLSTRQAFLESEFERKAEEILSAQPAQRGQEQKDVSPWAQQFQSVRNRQV